ncbi:molybdate ABC transporter substrate-binding protein [Desulforhopalus sp. IMCC35007]|nr:molybdate ABC transporter substrate-binding protein [Desulforhopalus sp. IMCC35007]
MFTHTLLFLLFGAISVQAETIYISVAASMTDALNEIISDFAANHPDAKILPNFASSGSLAKQIDQGAPADLYVSANPKWMKFLVEKQMISTGTDHVFAYNQLVFVGSEQTKAKEMAQITELKRIAIGSPQSVPAGQYAKQAMEAVGIYSELENTKKLVMAKDVRQALLYADRGEVDGSFVYRTDAMLAQNAKILFTVPDDLYNRVAYPLALTTAGAEKTTAKEFYDFLVGEKATAILEKYGFEPAH